jgi:hypothetical protein
MKKDKLLESFESFEMEKAFQKKIVGGSTSTGECSTLTQTYTPTRDHYDDCDVDDDKPHDA